jgi:hypothetical protein
VAGDHRLWVQGHAYSGSPGRTADDALHMRDDVLGLAALKAPVFQAVPVQTLSRTSPGGKQSFANVLTRATTPTAAATTAAQARAATLPGAAALPRGAVPASTAGLPAASAFPKPALPKPAAMMPKAALPLAATLPKPPSVSTALAQKPGASTALAQAPKPYVSPMKRPTVPSQPSTTATRKPTPPTPGRAPTGPTPPSRPTTVDHTQPSLPAVASPEPAHPFDPSQIAGALGLGSYPHPDQDNGRGMHWVPTTKQTPANVDRFVAEAQRMGVKWVTFLNHGTSVGDNDYLVTKLAAAGIEPVMRIFSGTLAPLTGDVEGMVRHYTGLGVHYFQPFNEPNLKCENPDGKVSVDRYLDVWIPAAKAIVRGGGLPGFGSMAPGGDYDDQKFLTAALDGLKARGEVHVLDKAWLSMHNYTWNHPIEDRGDGDGFFKFRAYHKTIQAALGRDLPIIGTEGGSMVGEQEDTRMAAVTPGLAADWTQQAFTYMRDKREPWLFASSVWTIADLAAGGHDPRFEAPALFQADGTQSAIVNSLKGLA